MKTAKQKRDEFLKTGSNESGLVHISEWLTRIGEHDSACIAEVMKQVKDDPEAMKYFLDRAKPNNAIHRI